VGRQASGFESVLYLDFVIGPLRAVLQYAATPRPWALGMLRCEISKSLSISTPCPPPFLGTHRDRV
jgi:hypothetical protein